MPEEALSSEDLDLSKGERVLCPTQIVLVMEHPQWVEGIISITELDMMPSVPGSPAQFC